MKLRHRNHSIPELNMTSMPDLIFTVLFFFMIVTHIRENTVHVKFQRPEGTNLSKITHKGAVINVFVGRDYVKGEYCVQVENDVVPIESLTSSLIKARGKISSDEMEYLSASLQADNKVPMSIINRVKMSMREAHILKVTYLAQENETILKPAEQDSH